MAARNAAAKSATAKKSGAKKFTMTKTQASEAPRHAGAAAEASGDYLRMLGRRVRDARARHGMTRRMLAHDCGVSERYLAQLESGRGNLSIMLLRRVAAAIDVPLTELVSEELPPLEYALVSERLRRLAPAELAEAAAILARRFGDSSARTARIALIGLRGAGKSTLGALLAKRLGWDFIELSREIEREADLSVNGIFDLFGQAAYRRYERRALERIVRTRTRAVVATGGGLVAELPTLERLLETCYTVWLHAAPEDYWERVRRQGDYRVSEGVGAKRALADMRRILSQREALYAKADVALDTSGRKVAESLHQLMRLIPAAAGGAQYPAARIAQPAAMRSR